MESLVALNIYVPVKNLNEKTRFNNMLAPLPIHFFPEHIKSLKNDLQIYNIFFFRKG